MYCNVSLPCIKRFGWEAETFLWWCSCAPSPPRFAPIRASIPLTSFSHIFSLFRYFNCQLFILEYIGYLSFFFMQTSKLLGFNCGQGCSHGNVYPSFRGGCAGDWKGTNSSRSCSHYLKNLTHPVCVARSTWSIRHVWGARKSYRVVKSVCIARWMLECYSFSTICYFRRIAVFEIVVRAMQSGLVRLLNILYLTLILRIQVFYDRMVNDRVETKLNFTSETK